MIIDLSILNADLENIETYLRPISYSPVLHMDIMDGKFVKQTSFDESVVRRCERCVPKAVIDTHLMVKDPINYLDRYIESGSDFITIHVEAEDVLKCVNYLKEKDIKVGISLNPETNVHELDKYLDCVDQVLVMSVHPGLGGQKFIESSLDKIKYLYNYKREHNLHYLINVDGGINNETIKLVKNYVDLCVVGSAITKAENYVEEYKKYFLMSQEA